MIPVERGTRYRLDLVVKDVNSGNVGVQRRGIIPPPYTPEGLASSTLLISDHIVPLKEADAAGIAQALTDLYEQTHGKFAKAANKPLIQALVTSNNISDVNSAYCVAVNRVLVRLDK